MGFEPMNEGFADPCLTRLGYVAVLGNVQPSALSLNPMLKRGPRLKFDG
jgi:hypothetical protein